MTDFDYSPYADAFLATFSRAKGQAQYYMLKSLPEMQAIHELSQEIMELMFPGRCGICTQASCSLEEVVKDQMRKFSDLLYQQVLLAYQYDCPNDNEEKQQLRAREDVQAVLFKLPQIRKSLKLDAKAGFEGDPAATNVREVILSYPCMKTMTIYRIAHELYLRHVPLVPRMLTEFAHQETGIDINPGAQIGSSFFIDHGTGVVIGETTIIGNNVKMYQGVTLGALSFPKDACGMLIRGTKRHPTISDNVTIYSNATILGDITIGKNAIIGSNVWIKEDVPENTMVMLQPPKFTLRDLSKRK
ncbi:MAG: serine O-acetyltransferase EpsC [Sphaerochaetaceae bacterium]